MFRQIPIEITVGSHVVALLPVYIPKGKQQPVVEMLHTKVTKVVENGPDKIISIKNPNDDKGVFVIPDWRVTKYTFGKIWLFYHKFDKQRIDAQDMWILKKLNYPIDKLKTKG